VWLEDLVQIGLELQRVLVHPRRGEQGQLRPPVGVEQQRQEEGVQVEEVVEVTVRDGHGADVEEVHVLLEVGHRSGPRVDPQGEAQMTHEVAARRTSRLGPPTSGAEDHQLQG
jgi:hypothetical protein